MPWILKLEKDDFVGKWAAEHVQERGPRERLVGFTMPEGLLPLEAGRSFATATSRDGSRAFERASGSAE